jgi:hypothetical protein
MEWACKHQNQYVEEHIKDEDLAKKGEFLMNCQDQAGLLKKYGPDYEALRAKLGHVKGLFDGIKD